MVSIQRNRNWATKCALCQGITLLFKAHLDYRIRREHLGPPTP